MLILGIETSCDDTCASVVEDGKRVLSNIVQSQDEYHRHFSGIVPEIASRKHIQNLLPVVDLALSKAGVDLRQIEALAVTHKPGLIGSLLVGLQTAKALAYASNKPLVGVNHLLAHTYAPALTQELVYPHLSLLVSGGHTLLLKVASPINATILGSTLDDSCGECFDKIAKYLGFGFPGGELIDKKSLGGNENAFQLPVSFLKKDERRYQFSYSGLKTAAILSINQSKKDGSWNENDFLASFQKAAVTPLVQKIIWAAEETGISHVSICGGVAKNRFFREAVSKLPLKTFIPPMELCADNAAMVAGIGHPLYLNKSFSSPPYSFSADASSFKNKSFLDNNC